MRRQSIVAGCRMSESRIIVGSSRGGVARVSHANIFNPFQGWKPDGMPDGSKFLAKNPPKGILSFSLGERDDERVLLLLLFERIFSRMIHWRPIRPLPFPSRYLSLNATGVISIDGNEPPPTRFSLFFEGRNSRGTFHPLDEWTKLVRYSSIWDTSLLFRRNELTFFYYYLFYQIGETFSDRKSREIAGRDLVSRAYTYKSTWKLSGIKEKEVRTLDDSFLMRHE